MSYSEEQVRAIWDAQRAKAKGRIVHGKLENKDGHYPEMWPGYNASIEQRRGLMPHIEPGAPFDHLFLQRSPNMSQEEVDYLLANSKQTTLPVYSDLANTVNRGMSDGNWSLKFTDPQSPFALYVEKGIREWGSITNFFTSAFLRIKLSDAMGVVAVLPEKLNLIQVGEEVQIDPEIPVEPLPTYYDCARVWGFEYDRWYLLRMNRDTRVNKGRGEGAPGVLCMFVDDTNVWTIRQTGRDSDQEYDIVLEFAHNCGEPPCIHNRGDLSAVDNGTHSVWKSPYLPAKDCLDLSLMDSNMLQATKNKLMYPHMVVVGNTCTFTDPMRLRACDNGRIKWTDDDDVAHSEACSNCHGTGKVSTMSPLKELVVSPTNMATGEATSVNANSALSFVGPETSSAAFMRSEIDVEEKKARQLLHIDAERPMSGGDAKTATEAGLNAKSRDAFVKPIIDQTFDIFEFTLRMIEAQRGDNNAFALLKPTNYDLRSPEEYLWAAQNAMEKGMPAYIVEDLTSQWLTVQYAGDEFALSMFTAIEKADRLASMSWEQVTAERAAGHIKPWEAILHESARHIYMALWDADQAFGSRTTREQANLMVEKAKEMAGEAAPSVQSRMAVVTPSAPAA
jgi:hypothetical protein